MKMFSALQSSSERDFNQQCFLFVFISEAGEQNLTRTIITVQYNSTAENLSHLSVTQFHLQFGELKIKLAQVLEN